MLHSTRYDGCAPCGNDGVILIRGSRNLGKISPHQKAIAVRVQAVRGNLMVDHRPQRRSEYLQCAVQSPELPDPVQCVKVLLCSHLPIDESKRN